MKAIMAGTKYGVKANATTVTVGMEQTHSTCFNLKIRNLIQGAFDLNKIYCIICISKAKSIFRIK